MTAKKVGTKNPRIVQRLRNVPVNGAGAPEEDPPVSTDLDAMQLREVGEAIAEIIEAEMPDEENSVYETNTTTEPHRLYVPRALIYAEELVRELAARGYQISRLPSS